MPKLTKRLIDSIPFSHTGQLFLRDTELPGFALRVTKGSKTFVLEKRIQGRMRRITIGPFGPLTLEQARKEARELIGRIAKGEDPAQDKISHRQESTFGALADTYLERHAPRKRSARNDRAMIKNLLTPWQNRKLSAIYRNDVSLLHAKIGKDAPYQANRLVALIRKMFNLANLWGMYQGENPATGIELFKEEKRDRFLNLDEVRALMRELAKEADPYIQGAFLVALLTGARIGEVLSMQWEDMDLKEGIWRIPQTKAGRPHRIPLPRPLMARISALPRLEGNPYLFPGRYKKGHLVDVSGPWGRIRSGAKIPDVRIHDLRRTLGSWLAGSGASLPLIGKVLNHSQPSTTAIYARLDLEPVRLALEANAERMIAVGRKRPEARKKRSLGRP